ncbi:MAG: alpha/beta fold hydrolase [Bacteroidales bacterium]|nr:alpha/beta fold hydrolase [Bacteroidales bacterium]
MKTLYNSINGNSPDKDRMKLFFRKYGKGPVLVILHGLFGSSGNWVSVARDLSNSFTVYLPDLRNHGLSPHSDSNGYDDMCGDLHELVKAEKIGKFFLAGHSMGGKCAAAFAIKWPELLSGLLVADISPFRQNARLEKEFTKHREILDAIAGINPAELRSRMEAEGIIARTIADEKLRGFIMKNLERGDDNSFRWRLNAKALSDNLRIIAGPLQAPALYSGQVSGFPVIFLRGELSPYLPEEDFNGIRSVFPAADFVEVKGAGHWIHSDAREEVVRCLKMFLDY